MLKKVFVEKIEEIVKLNPNAKILDLGCGDATNFVWLIKKYPTIKYLGIEPGKEASEKASKTLSECDNAEIVNTSAYSTAKDHKDFDIVCSLSVLEHVKQLELFLKNSIDSLKTGGRLIHRYDLGHVLYPSSAKERFQAFLSKYFTMWLPESKVIRHINLDWLIGFLGNNGVDVTKTTYHQMPHHKTFLKNFKLDSEEKEKLAREIVEWEYKVSAYLDEIDQSKKEEMFPSVCVWGVKK